MESKKQNNKKIKNSNRLIDAENKLMVARGVGVGGLGEKGEGIKYKLEVTK